MIIIGNVLVGLVALIHAYILVLEMFLWTGRRFPYYSRLAVESVLVASARAEVEGWRQRYEKTPKRAANRTGSASL